MFFTDKKNFDMYNVHIPTGGQIVSKMNNNSYSLNHFSETNMCLIMNNR